MWQILTFIMKKTMKGQKNEYLWKEIGKITKLIKLSVKSQIFKQFIVEPS